VEYSERPPEGGRGGGGEGGGGGGPFGGGVNALYSLGLRVGGDGTVQESIVGGPADMAGITSGMRIVAVDDRAFTADLLHDALKAGKTNNRPMRLLVLSDDYYKACTIDYHGGERYPHLVRQEGTPDLLDEISKPLVASK